MIARLWSLFFPAACALCGQVLAGETDAALCDECVESIAPVVWPPCPCAIRPDDVPADERASCALCSHLPAPPTTLRAAFWYDDPAGKLVRELKYRHAPWLAQALARMAIVACADHIDRLRTHHAIDLVVPVAMHPWRAWRRGHNHAALIADRMAAALGIECAPHALVRLRWVPQQSRKAGADARLANVAGSFGIAHGVAIEGRRVLLVDDVLTTGATMATAAMALNAAGAASVHALAITIADHALVDASVGDGFARADLSSPQSR